MPNSTQSLPKNPSKGRFLPEEECGMQRVMQELLDEMENLTRAAGSQPTPTGIPRVAMIRGEVLSSQLTALYEPMIGVVLQGAKTLKIGDQVLRCQAPSYFVLPVELPVVGMVHQGDSGLPYLSVGLTLDHERIAQLLRDLPLGPDPDRPSQDFVECPANEDFLGAWLRLLRLMRSPKDIPALAPAYEREILYRVLQGPQGWMLRELANLGSSLNRIEKAASWIKEHLEEPMSIDFLARQAGMSNTAYHRHFRAATGMSPIQFQKHLRLHKARRLLVVGAPSVSTVAYQVGYQSASQFNREYTRLFGRSPAKDVAELRREGEPVGFYV
jgi:AraC-like DNA-binding protein